jgi:acyl-CoA synthetase (AMP-forming)/AMP-acid ligase II
MSDENFSLGSLFNNGNRPETPVTYHGGRYYTLTEFQTTITYWSDQFKNEPFSRHALFTEDAYPFAVLLLAALHAGKEVWLPGNNLPETADNLQKLDCRLIGDWMDAKAFNTCFASEKKCDDPPGQLDSATAQVVLMTSGSTGQPKLISKSLVQLETEVNALERLWGKQLGSSVVHSTVSHQHIYGFLFRVLWPLLARRCFHSETHLNPEMLVNNILGLPACWVASPAHLKRLDQASPWRELAGLSAIFSSGGVLPDEARRQISQQCGQQVLEIYGSTETGGIAWRIREHSWITFPRVSLTPDGNRWKLHSPYLKENGSYLLEDDITLLDDGRFILNGRSDRIVKIEEKRLSLAELERRLTDTPWVEEACATLINQHRDMVCVVLVLTQAGLQKLTETSRSAFINQLKKQLESWFEVVMLPRKWLFVNKIPLTVQGKIDSQLLISLLASDKRKLPLVHALDLTNDQAELKLKVPQVHELIYFAGHFQGHPILPGVVQLAWVEHFGKLVFPIDGVRWPFSHLEVIKFIRIIPPETEIKLTLKWNESKGELQFNYASGTEPLSSGRMMFRNCQTL